MRVPAARPVIQGPELSLLTAAAQTQQPDRWENGFSLPAVSCGNLLVYTPGCAAPDQIVTLLDRGSDDGQDYDPFTVQTWFECTLMGSAGLPDDVQQQATEQLDALTAYAVEHELWTGELTDATPDPEGHVNRRLASPDAEVLTTGTTGVSPLAVVGLLEEALGAFPGRSWVHASLRGASFLATQASRDGQLLRTKLGSVIVGGAGYPGTGPDGAPAPAGTTWVYGTSPVTVRLTPGVVPASGVEVIDRDRNKRRVRAERTAAATWDGCAHFAALMTLKSD